MGGRGGGDSDGTGGWVGAGWGMGWREGHRFSQCTEVECTGRNSSIPQLPQDVLAKPPLPASATQCRVRKTKQLAMSRTVERPRPRRCVKEKASVGISPVTHALMSISSVKSRFSLGFVLTIILQL